MPADSNMAFVIVQHLDPSGHSSMPEILSRFTTMPVHVTTDGMKVEPNSIYLIPPAKSMSILDGSLYLQEPERSPGLRLPVDFFFRSLAKEKGPDAIVIILSGTGTDGALGIRAIKAETGTVFVQDPESARYDGMPHSAIDTGLADIVAKPEDMPEKLKQFIKHSTINGSREGATVEEAREPLQQIFAFLRTRTGHDFSRYKPATHRRRLRRRMSVNEINDIAEYADFLKENTDEVKALLKDLLTSVTNFFRDPEAFESLKEHLKKIIRKKAHGSELRVWVAGCATGEEAYSVGIIISECMSELKKRLQIQMYGTDIDVEALQVARAGLYPANIAADVTAERLKRFFIKEKDKYRIKKEIREMVVFAPQNFIKDPPFSRMDLICSRNLLIYLEVDVQKRLLPLLHYTLKPNGILFLGPSENVGESTDFFSTLDRKWKIYERSEVVVTADRLRFPASFTPGRRGGVAAVEQITELGEARIPQLTEKIFLDYYAPTFAVVDEKYRLVYVRGRTGRFLEIASGQPSLSILEMAREGLSMELASAMYRASSEKKSVTHEGVRVRNNGGFQTINLTVAPLSDPGIPPGYLIIVFQEVGTVAGTEKAGPTTKSRKHAAQLEEELKLTKENLQATNEELQSNNEELTTLNAELQDKNELLTKANDDLRNFLNRTDIAILFLDEELKIRSFTPASVEVFNIRDIDIGRPISEITSQLSYGGLVMSFLDIDAQKKSAESLRETRDYLDNLIDHANAPIIVWDPKLKITRFNRAFERLTGRRAELANQAIEELHQHPSEHSILLDIPDGLPQVVVDPVRFQRVLHNLVENAIKYSPKRTEIRIFARQENRKVVVGVSDQGPGISVQDQKRLFEPFQRLGLKPTTSGVGLGLVVCKRLVEAHGGSIWVESKPGEGAAFLFTILLGNRRGKLALKADGLQKLDV